MKIIKIYKSNTQVAKIVAEGDPRKMRDRLKQLRSGVKGKANGRGGKKYAVEYKLID